MSKGYRRRRKLIKPSLQLKLTGLYLATASVAFLLLAVMVYQAGMDIFEKTGADMTIVREEMTEVIVQNIVLTLAVFVPLMVAVGIFVTFKIAGPLYRFELFLEQVAAGENPPPCKIRKDDELHEFCELLNRVTEPLRSYEDEGSGDEGAEALSELSTGPEDGAQADSGAASETAREATAPTSDA